MNMKINSERSVQKLLLPKISLISSLDRKADIKIDNLAFLKNNE